MAAAEQNECETYRVIILNRRRREVLIALPDGGRFTLPCVTIPRWQRVAENLTAAVKAAWGEEVICLLTPDTASTAEHGSGIHYQVTEHWRANGRPETPTRWAALSALSRDSFLDPSDCLVIRQSLAKCQTRPRETLADPFARLGWFREVRQWVAAAIEPRGLHINQNFRQLNAGPSFSLVRFETDGPAVWFKAVGKPNQREFTITRTLAQLFPRYLPPLLAARPDWNGWLTEEVEGGNLSESKDSELWIAAAAAFARLQIESIDRRVPILAAGARDLRFDALSDHVQPFLEVMGELMERQTKTSPPILDREDLWRLENRIQDALDMLHSLGIPDALGHLDLNPGNIIVSSTRCAFLDWAEAYIGNPFFSFQYLREHLQRTLGAASAAETRLMESYGRQWKQVVPPAAIAEALPLTSLLAVFAYAAGSGAWRDPERLADPNTAGYLRSLTRRMNREANQLSGQRSICVC